MDDTSTELIKERKASEVEYYSYMSFIASILTTAVCVQSLPCNTERGVLRHHHAFKKQQANFLNY
jgi:hypothetical protein